jgi:hypothetical protein
MLTLDLKRSKGNDRLTLVAAHPPKVGEGRAPRFVVGLKRTKARVRHPPEAYSEDAETHISNARCGAPSSLFEDQK